MRGRVDRIMQEINRLSADELQHLLRRITDRLEILGMLKIVESVFADWDNEEDSVYDDL